MEILSGAPKSDSMQIGIYHHDYNTKQDKLMGKAQLKVSTLPRGIQVDHFCKLHSGAGEVVLSLRRAPIVSPELAITLKVCSRVLSIFLFFVYTQTIIIIYII